MELRTVKTDEFTIKSGHIDVGDGHKVWFEQWGNPHAKIPILMFHGGPGGELKAKHKYGFDPKNHQIIGFDQRGSGNSLPYGELKNNTTQHILSDSNKILTHLGITKVHASGGSWGSTLALLFAIENPEKIATLLINGVFTGSQKEIEWIDKGHFKSHYPEVWTRFVKSVPEGLSQEPASYHYRVLAGEIEGNQKKSAKALSELEYPMLIFDWRGYTADDIKKDSEHLEDYDEVPYLIYAHFFKNNSFLKQNYILENLHKITAPTYIVQGRYDMVCPPNTAYEVHENIKGSKLYMTLSSHSVDSETNTALKILKDLIY
jgi:proline iminopeptidase